MRISVILAFAVVVLAGCTKTVAEMSYSERKTLAGQIVQRCMAQGVKLNTKEMDTCTYVEAQREVTARNINAIRERRAMASLSAGLQNASNSYYSAARNNAAMNRPTTCRTVPSPAGMATVRCY